MFITVTIDTKNRKRKLVRMKTKRFNPAGGWRRAVYLHKDSFWQRFKAWRRSLKAKRYAFKGQTAMF